MNQQRKRQEVESLRADFAQHDASFVVGVQGLTVDEMQQLRKQVRPYGKIKVSKNTLVSIVVRENPAIQLLEPYCKNQVAFVFVAKEAPNVAKVLRTFAQEHEKLKLVAGYMDAQLLDAQKITFIASLPSKEVLVAQLCGLLQSPIVKLAWVLKQAAEKNQQSE